ncbi:MAG: hypothetical protein ACK5WZ_00635, partial [Pseudobdellovibrionaceae bacterium]
MLKRNPKSLLFSGVFFASMFCQAGAVSGGGAKSVVCRNSQQQILSVELLDLWEAKNLFKKEINVAESSVPKLVDDAFLNLKNAIDWTGRTAYFDGAKTEGPDALYSELSYLAQPFLKEDPKVSYLDNVKLTDTQDSFELIQPSEGSGCKIEQLVNYLDLENRVLVNNDLFKQMDSV